MRTLQLCVLYNRLLNRHLLTIRAGELHCLLPPLTNAIIVNNHFTLFVSDAIFGVPKKIRIEFRGFELLQLSQAHKMGNYWCPNSMNPSAIVLIQILSEVLNDKG